MRTRERSPNRRPLWAGHRTCWLALTAAIFCLTAAPAPAQDNEKCLECHSDKELTGTFAGEDISVFVDEEDYAASVHSGVACVDCHSDLDPTKRRHSTRKDLELVDCSGCHRPEANAHKRSLHGIAAKDGDPMAPVCADCHGKHDILPASDHDSPTAVMNVPLLCGSCHREGSPVSRTHEISQENILEHYSMSIHGEGLFRQGLTVTAVCTSCHTSHDIRSSKASCGPKIRARFLPVSIAMRRTRSATFSTPMDWPTGTA
jgi:hypothetical protein